MINGVDTIIVKVTLADEYGIYRRYRASIDTLQEFLLFSCTTKTEALSYGEGIAEMLRVPLRSEITKEMPEEISPSTSPTSGATPNTASKKRVTGVKEKVIAFIAAGKDDPTIVQELIPMYTEAGRTETQARELLKPYVAEIRKLQKKGN